MFFFSVYRKNLTYFGCKELIAGRLQICFLTKEEAKNALLKETGEEVDDELQEVFVNMEIDDGSQIARLMDLFTKPVIQSAEFPEISRRNSEVKNTEGGLATMCEVVNYPAQT